MFKGKGERETKIKVSFTKKTIFKEKREREKSRFSSRRKRSLKEKEREKRIEVSLPKKRSLKEKERKRKKSRFNRHEAKIVKPNINTGSNDGGNEEEWMAAATAESKFGPGVKVKR